MHLIGKEVVGQVEQVHTRRWTCLGHCSNRQLSGKCMGEAHTAMSCDWNRKTKRIDRRARATGHLRTFCAEAREYKHKRKGIEGQRTWAIEHRVKSF